MLKLQQSPPDIATPSKMELIKEIVWMANANTATIAAMCDAAEEVFVDEGDVIIRQGESGTNLFLIARGTATVKHLNSQTGVEEIVSEVGVGQLIGELAWLTGDIRNASVLAASRGVIFAFNGAKIKHIMEDDEEAHNAAVLGANDKFDQNRTPSVNKKLWEIAGCRMGKLKSLLLIGVVS